MRTAFKENLLRKLGEESFTKIQEARIAIAGAGGLGSNCAAILVRTGFRNLKIVDFDRVEAPNLDRQFYFADQVGMPKVEALRQNLLRINPELGLWIENVRLERSNARALLGDCDIVAECLDTAEGKSMLVSELLPDHPFIVAVSGLGGLGESDEIRVHRIRTNLVVIGDLRSDIAFRPALSPRVAVAAAKQADVILEHVALGRIA
ncbi:MAG: Molybdopterin-synthase adenylyltransferase [Syntrophaceae bacterium PtaU1.Bin231]|nr:MAG: Molybdopterin-synthase adenylyltransferase [Syntrophaceae bacterium PtaU1.Bin231]